MIIKINKISFITSGHAVDASLKIERTILEPIWLNSTHIAKMSIAQGPENSHDITHITWRVEQLGNHTTVLETPPQIIALISDQQ